MDEACKIEMAHLGLDNPRTSSPPRLQAWIETLQASDALRNRSHSQDHLAAKLKRAGKSQRWQDQVVNLILASVDRVLDEDEPRRTPLVLFGSGGGKPKRGQTVAGSVSLRNHVRKFFTVIIVEEFRTSQVCPHCLGQNEDVRGCPRSKWCSSCELFWNRDIGAALAIFKVFVCQVAFGVRPKGMRRRWDVGGEGDGAPLA